MPEEPNGLSRSGRDRLDLVEMQQNRLLEMVGSLGNKVDVMLERQSALRERLDAHDGHHARWETRHDQHVEEHETRHRTLDWKVAGLLAGLVTAAVGIIWQGGAPSL